VIVHRDRNACLNIARLGLSLAFNRRRPPELLIGFAVKNLGYGGGDNGNLAASSSSSSSSSPSCLHQRGKVDPPLVYVAAGG
jgi:transposase